MTCLTVFRVAVSVVSRGLTETGLNRLSILLWTLLPSCTSNWANSMPGGRLVDYVLVLMGV